MTDLKDPDERKKEADAKSAEAAAAQAAAEAAAAKVAAEKAALEKAEWESELAKKAREADLRKAVADAEKAMAAAQADQISSLIPDFTNVERGTIEVSGEEAVASSALTQMALRSAANELVAGLKPTIGEGETILITTDSDLASSDAVYLAVVSGLDNLIASADRILKPGGRSKALRSLPAAPLAAAVASAVPGLLSLFSARRKLSTFALNPDSNAAVAAVSGALLASKPKTVRVRLDDFRLATRGAIAGKEASLRERLDKLREDPKKPGAEELIKTIAPFLTTLHTLPDGSERSLFALASLREQLHPRTTRRAAEIPKVLFLHASGGSATQLLNDRPLLWQDKLHVLGSVSVTYWLLDVSTNDIVAAGVVTGWAEMKGTVGKEMNIEPIDSRERISANPDQKKPQVK